MDDDGTNFENNIILYKSGSEYLISNSSSQKLKFKLVGVFCSTLHIQY